MQYVPFGDLGFNISRLGFGMMRLPKVTLPDGSTALDEARATAMLRSAIDQGLSYVDTAYPYCDGQSEPLVGRILKDGYRERVKLATKLPVWKVETRQDMDAVLDEQLKRLDVPYVDFYLLHALGRERWEKMKALGVREFLDSAVKDGRIRYPAFSFHDDYEVFRDILTSYDWRMAQIQFNYLDIRHQAGLRGIRLARARRVPLVVMEPLRGGALANPPAEVRAMMERYPVQCSPVEWAFRYVGDFDQVAVMLSGMSDEAQVQDNLRIFENVRPGCLSDADEAAHCPPARRLSQAHAHRLHGLRLLRALPQGRGHSARVRRLQRSGDVRPHGGLPAPVSELCGKRAGRGPLRALRAVRGQVPAASAHPRLAADRAYRRAEERIIPGMRTKLFGVVSIYGVLIALAVLCAVILCQREGRRRGLPEDIGLDMALWAVPLGVVCARLYYVIFRWDYYAQNPVSILYFWQGGLAIYGGVIGGALGLYLLSRRRRISCLTLFDMAAPLVILGQAIGRWGNLFNGEAYGYPVQSAFWQFFPVAVQVDGVWHLATFFYESCWDLAGFIVLWRYRLRARRAGDVFFLYLLWYGAGRTIIEGLRTDSLMLGPIRVSQLLSLALCLCGLAHFWRGKRCLLQERK